MLGYSLDGDPWSSGNLIFMIWFFIGEVHVAPHGFGHGGSSDLLCYAFDLLDPTKNLDPLFFFFFLGNWIRKSFK